MTQDLPSYIANDAAPLFPDLSAMSHEEFCNYEAPPERLAFYQLHTEEGLKAFLYDVYWIGYPGLFIAANHVWNLLIAPRAYHCTLMGQLSGAGGAGKQALVNTLRKFIGEGLAIDHPKPKLAESESLEAWHNGWMEAIKAEERELQLLIDKYVAILNGEPIEHIHPDGQLVSGPWKLFDHRAEKACPVEVVAERCPV
jgi:hypothetical protein